MSNDEYQPNDYTDYKQLRKSKEKPPLWAPWYGIGFFRAIGRFFHKTFIFHGRASRSEYWWTWLFSLLLTACASTIASGIAAQFGYSFEDGSQSADSPLAFAVYHAAVIVQIVLWLPTLSLSVRRLHDRNKRGWWVLFPSLLQLLAIVVAVGILVVAAMQEASVGMWAGSIAGAILTFLGLSLLAFVSSFTLMIGGSNPLGVRFDKPTDREYEHDYPIDC